MPKHYLTCLHFVHNRVITARIFQHPSNRGQHFWSIVFISALQHFEYVGDDDSGPNEKHDLDLECVTVKRLTFAPSKSPHKHALNTKDRRVKTQIIGSILITIYLGRGRQV